MSTSSAPPLKPLVPAKAKRKKMPLWVWAVGGVLFLGLGWFGWTKTHSDSGLGPTLTGNVKKGDLLETVSATGSVAAQTGAEVHIGSQITGRIKHLYADVGTEVKAGELIAQLDLPDIQAQLDLAKAVYTSAESKVTQQKQNLTLGFTQTQSGVGVARASLRSSLELLNVAKANSLQQNVQTPADIAKAETALEQAVATLSSSTATLTQTQAGADLNIQTAEEALTQAQATDKNNQLEYQRELSLVQKGFVAQSAVDQAKQTADVSQSQVRSVTKALDLVKQKVTADLQTARDQVVQSQQGVAAAKAALTAARAETYTTSAKEAGVADAEAAVAQARANLALALGNLESNAVHQQDVAQAEAAVKQASDQIAVNQAQVDKTYIRSPISGTVLQLAAQQGETLAAGLSAPTLIVVADLTRLEVDAYVDETDIGKVRVGQPVSIVVDAFPDQPMQGAVAKVSAGSTIQQGIVTYQVKVSVKDATHQLRPDMTASVSIQTGKLSNVLIVPSVAIQIGVSGSTVNVLTKVDGQSVIKPVPVKTGGSDGVNTQILSGLSEGDVIVLAGGQSSAKKPTSNSPFGGSGGGGGRGGGGRG